MAFIPGFQASYATVLGKLAIEAARSRKMANSARAEQHNAVAVAYENYANELAGLHTRIITPAVEGRIDDVFFATEHDWATNELTFVGRVSKDTGEISDLIAKSRALTFYRDTLDEVIKENDSEATQEVAAID